ncbi:MAG: RNA polymerase sigma factor [Myxococcota bacterium]|nr:RNA polymerase sigma factor [Myxococcota bacterium]
MVTKKQEMELVDRALLGDEQAFTNLIKPLRDKIYWRAVKALRDLDQAEDVTQETMIRAFTRLSTFRGESRFSSWLYMVASNCIRMHIRSAKRKGALRLDDNITQVETQSHNVLLLPSKLPDEAAEDTQIFTAIEEAIDTLPEQYGAILRLWVEDGLDLREIHEESGLSIAAIKSRLHRARRRLKEQLDARYGEGTLLAA